MEKQIGGATGAIGDPSGRSTERNALAADTVKANSDSLGRQLQKLFQNMSDHVSRRGQTLPISSPPKILNNSDWFAPMGLLPFLGDLGRHFRVSVMLSRDSVKSRLSSTQGISFTEFSYQILQAFDFYHLYDKEGCAIQLGGSDQWGNMSAGLELIKKKREEKTLSLTSKEKNDAVQAAHPVGITLPLVTTASGDKFGKSAGNAVWLDEKLTSPLDFYQVKSSFLLVQLDSHNSL